MKTEKQKISAREEDILSSINNGSKCGAEIKEDIRNASDGTLDLSSGTIYPILKRLEKKKLIFRVPKHKTGEKEGRKISFQLSEEGINALKDIRSFRHRLIKKNFKKIF